MVGGRVAIAVALPAVVLLPAAACGGNGANQGNGGQAQETTPTESEPAQFSAIVDHPLVPLSSIRLTVFEGVERDPDTGERIELRIESRVLDQTRQLAGVEVAVVQVKDFEDGELVERTLDYYAQHEDGSVWYFGEHVDDIEEGKVVGHMGQWIAGQNGAKPGIFMPAEPEVGDKFEQERAPGIAEDRSEVVAAGLEVTTPAGTFSDCIKTEDFAPLDKVTEFKYYCPGVGLVREEPPDGRIDLISYR
jgi:hypothetical protein